jgi:hypothetical protein
MSYYIHTKDLKIWLDKSQLALVSKNKIRKDLWTDFGDIILFEADEDTVPISSSEFTTIQSFLQNEGRSDNISSDSMLNWITMLHDLRRKFIKEIKVHSAPASQSSSPKSEDEKNYSIPPKIGSEKVAGLQIHKEQ